MPTTSTSLTKVAARSPHIASQVIPAEILSSEQTPVVPKTENGHAKLWRPKQVLVTPAAYEEAWGQQIIERVQALGIPVKRYSQIWCTGDN